MSDVSKLHNEVLENLKRELLIVFLRRLGGEISIPVNEIDATEGIGLAFRIDEKNVFHFKLEYLSERKKDEDRRKN